ncbi:MAG TPA: hypothetical protein VME68_18115 [Acidobacteriaceae bacterium]|nr:hypothetical protein [Acidobacteriaceae bacterium]
MQAENFDEHHLREIFALQNASWLRIPDDSHHAFEIPLQGCAVFRVSDMDKSREHLGQNVCVLACETEVSAESEAGSTTLPGENAAIQFLGNHRDYIDRGNGQIACDAERRSVRQHGKLSGLQQNWLIDSIDRKPARAGDEPEAEEAAALCKLKRPITTGVDSARLVAARFEKRKHVRKGIVRNSGRSRY